MVDRKKAVQTVDKILRLTNPVYAILSNWGDLLGLTGNEPPHTPDEPYGGIFNFTITEQEQQVVSIAAAIVGATTLLYVYNNPQIIQSAFVGAGNVAKGLGEAVPEGLI